MEKTAQDRWDRILSTDIFANSYDPVYNDNRASLNHSAALPKQLTLSVDHSQSLEDMIDAGNYDWRHRDITSRNFPVAGEGTAKYEAKVFHFYRNISSQEAVGMMRSADSANPWKPGNVRHILSFGAKYPEEQHKYPIISLGSVALVYGGCYVSYLDRNGAKRGLNLYWWSSNWLGFCRFLAVRAL